MTEGLLAGVALAVSAAGILLVGVSLVIQNRQTRISQLQANRMYQLELFRLSYADGEIDDDILPEA